MQWYAPPSARVSAPAFQAARGYRGNGMLSLQGWRDHPLVKRIRPTSILQLTLIGFLLVALPLITALIIAVIQVDHLAMQSRRSVYDAAHAMQATHKLVEQITAMERSILQFQVLGEADLYENYLERHRNFERAAKTLFSVNLDTDQRKRLTQLAALEQAVYNRLRGRQNNPKRVEAAVAEFPTLANLARPMLYEASALIARVTGEMQQSAAATQRRLLLQAAALIPLALLLAGLFTVLITRPLRHIERAIRHLGMGDFSQPIRIKGPQDLQELSERLDWLRQRLMEVEQQKIDFLRHISHELKTPLTDIREGAELLADEVVGSLSEEQAEVARILRQNSLHLQKLIEDLLNFSFAPSKRLVANKAPLRVRPLIEDTIAEQKLAIKAKHVRLRTELEEVTVTGESELIRIILDNLLSNAVKYSPTGGRIHIALGARDGHAVLDMQDEGPGIDPQERSQVFEAFYQGETVPKGHVKGTGLGLSIAQEYVKLHQGSIEIIDQPRGAHLRVTLPLTSTETA